MGNPEFRVPGPMGPDIPFDELHVWQWARSTPRADVTIFKYLESVGFRVGVDRITEDTYKTLDYAIESFHRTEPRISEALPLSELFTPAKFGGFYVQGLSGRWNPTARVIETLGDAGWIYDVSPETTYFDVSSSTVWARYQSIIGSRAIARIAR